MLCFLGEVATLLLVSIPPQGVGGDRDREKQKETESEQIKMTSQTVMRPAVPRPLLCLVLLLLFSPSLVLSSFLLLSLPFPVKSVYHLKLSRRRGRCHLVPSVRVYNAPIKARGLGARMSWWEPK